MKPLRHLAPDEAAALIDDGMTVALGGFTAAGAPKAVPLALAARARAEHAAGRPFRVRLLSGASTGAADDALAEASAISFRAPYQSSRALRQQINAGEVAYVDLHLSHVAPMVQAGLLGAIDVAIVEATDVTVDGRIALTTGIGVAPTFLRSARRIVVELNRRQDARLHRLHDLAVLPPPPHRDVIPIHGVLDRIGGRRMRVEPDRIVGVVETDADDAVAPFGADDATCGRIAEHLVRFLLDEVAAGRLPPGLLPIQAGVGNVSNAVLAALGAHPDVPPFEMWTEVLQDGAVDLLLRGRITAASSCALTLSAPARARLLDAFDAVKDRLVLRPAEISNHPALARQLALIALNTALEVDLYGHVNSTHVLGTQMMNGIGGSGDFERNAYLSVFLCPSAQKGGAISTLVPMVSHVDHSEHSTQVVVTEQGLADLRGKAPFERARLLIEQCAHPAYRDTLRAYVASAPPGHLRHDLGQAFALHQRLQATGRMLP
ncbi:MAG: succinate CoA transferase [Gemmatimonadales bacterium]|nr:succinate CoA transferase [Gemmatimonadales bacterium]